jgi:hypothetical protein
MGGCPGSTVRYPSLNVAGMECQETRLLQAAATMPCATLLLLPKTPLYIPGSFISFLHAQHGKPLLTCLGCQPRKLVFWLIVPDRTWAVCPLGTACYAACFVSVPTPEATYILGTTQPSTSIATGADDIQFLRPFCATAVIYSPQPQPCQQTTQLSIHVLLAYPDVSIAWDTRHTGPATF